MHRIDATLEVQMANGKIYVAASFECIGQMQLAYSSVLFAS